jgi:hypothetical protein
MATVEDPPRYATAITVEGYSSEAWFTWFRENITRRLNTGLTVTVPLAKITGGGTDGSLTFTNGILTAVTQPT